MRTKGEFDLDLFAMHWINSISMHSVAGNPQHQQRRRHHDGDNGEEG
jgi:hypothetical protein